ncbi:GPI mannosyltransferase 3 [Scheffersomyces coipomensis]|uniref:GPI mannosyltransferase 3 n=1 Tax=Scheffersomyces coipomensis TaxID=1788519 RepID=UPI00315CFCB7
MQSIRNRSRIKVEDDVEAADQKEVDVQLQGTKSLSTAKLFFIIFMIRLFNALTMKTFFQADEYYQALEPAHAYVFGYGYVTWEWKERLRSSIHPWIYIMGYKLVSLFSDDVEMIILVPKVIGAILATIGEVGLYKLSQVYTKDEYISRVTLLLSLFNPFNWYIITRSFSNSFETILTILGLLFWPWDYKINYSRFIISFIFSITSILTRPTNGLIWGYLGLNYLINVKANIFQIIKLGMVFLITSIIIISISLGLDYQFYGELTFPVYNFIEFNVIKNLSIFYGVAPWHFYLFQTIPILLMTYLPFLIHSELWLKHYKDILSQVSIFVTIGFSLIEHKEFRFIYPLQPMFLILCSYSVKQFMQIKTIATTIRKGIIYLIIIINILITIFFSQIHERGAIDVIDYLKNDSNNVKSMGFLTPCHSTPWQSHIHNTLLSNNSWFLTCEPPLHLTDVSATVENIHAYRDESDQFYDNRLQFLTDNFPPFNKIDYNKRYHEWPSHLIIFEPEEQFMNQFLESSSYYQCRRFFNSYFHWDSRRNGDFIVYCKT